jgi:hypothetical protein
MAAVTKFRKILLPNKFLGYSDTDTNIDHPPEIKMSELNVPNFGELLSPYIEKVPPAAIPNFLALLERGAAQRYRDWADQLPTFSKGLLACSASEDKIADIIESLFLIDDELTAEVQAPLPEARDTYYNVFKNLSLADQLGIQADAELQGAEAWRVMISDDIPDEINRGLKQCMVLEEESSAYLYSILDDVRQLG